jgi:hypothetical protein
MEFVWVDLQHQPAGADVWVSFEGSGVLQCYLMLSSQFSAFSRGDAVDCYQFDVAPPERAVQIPSEGSWHVVMRGTGVAEVRVSSPARIDANVLAILQPEKHQDPTPEPGVPHLTELPRAGQGNQVDWLAGLQRATTQAVLDKMAKIDAIQRQLDIAAANATMSGPGSAGFDAADASFNQLKGDLIAALNELGNIPDYSTINPRSVTVSPGGNFLFDHTANGISVQTYGQYQNGNGTFFDQATGTYYTFTNGKLTSTSTPDPGRVTPDDELLFNTITTLVGAPEAAALIKGGGQAVFQGLKALLSREGADWVSGITGKNVLAEALAAAERRAASAPATIGNTTSGTMLGKDVITLANAPKPIFSPRQVQSKFKHAPAFGVEGNYNLANAERFQKVMTDFMSEPSTWHIKGTYRREPAIINVNPNTALAVLQHPSGEVFSMWKLNPEQLVNVLERGSL